MKINMDPFELYARIAAHKRIIIKLLGWLTFQISWTTKMAYYIFLNLSPCSNTCSNEVLEKTLKKINNLMNTIIKNMMQCPIRFVTLVKEDKN